MSIMKQKTILRTAKNQMQISTLGQNTCTTNKADVIFLIDSSTSVDRENFTKLLRVISGTVQLMNVGANETRIGVTKFTGSPVTEFSLNDFDNRKKILEALLNVRYVAGVTHLGAAIQYVTDKEFIHSKGDRADVANVMAIMSDGLTQDDVIQPSAIARTKRIDFVAVAIGKFYGKEQLMDITGGRKDRILRFQRVNTTVDMSQQLHDAIMKSVQEQCSQNTTFWETFTTATERAITSSTWGPHTPSPQHADIMTNCKDGSMEVTISKTPPYRGWLLVKGHQKKKGCFWDYTNNKQSNIHTTIDYSTCQAERRRSTNPDGVFVSMTIMLLKHPLLFQHVDRAYRLQCFYGGKETFVNRELQIEELTTIKTLEKAVEKPDCVYTIRRDTVNGPIVKFATLGMDIVHRWECESAEHDGENVYAMHVHSCYIKSETQEQVMVIDENGCPVKHSPIQKISYSPNQLLVSAKAPVVTLPDAGAIQFNCQVSLCLRQEESCLQLTVRNL
ncbi:VWA and Zona pellucida domain containing protein [Trichuris trichiura]|uniref:VWA and Zona pellucida domain containing protein n=1 Tax=Trichuris trichiura TaxID=36087 RepID=A0A077Z0Q4_TRITR|nr:VWA and Zona pellucida domain containing protein [Trichuris trichiura]